MHGWYECCMNPCSIFSLPRIFVTWTGVLPGPSPVGPPRLPESATSTSRWGKVAEHVRRKGGELRFLKQTEHPFGKDWKMLFFWCFWVFLMFILGCYDRLWGVVCIGSFCVAFLGLRGPNVFQWGSVALFFGGSLPWHNSNPNIGGQHLTADMLSYLLNFLVGMS